MMVVVVVLVVVVISGGGGSDTPVKLNSNRESDDAEKYNLMPMRMDFA